MRPSKTHFTRFVQQCNGVMCESMHEKISSVLYTVVNRAMGNQSLPSYYPVELALQYGLNNGLIRLGNKDEKGYHDVYFTETGFNRIIELKKKTCVFTGNSIK